jgi:hypothetical protein
MTRKEKKQQKELIEHIKKSVLNDLNDFVERYSLSADNALKIIEALKYLERKK